MFFPLRIVALLQQPAAEYRHELGELHVHSRTMQALVVVLPEDLPVALHLLHKNVANAQIAQRPVSQAVEWQVEVLLQGWRIRGQSDEYAALALLHGNLVERVVADVEAWRSSFG